MSTNSLAPAEPRFFFLMPVWGSKYIEYLLTFGLPTLLAPNNLPSLPNRAVSQFIFITRVEDEKPIRASKLFAKLEALIPVKFIFLDFYESDRLKKLGQLGAALKLGAGEALGRGYCLFFHPDGLYSDGMVKHLYDVARSGKKVCVTHGPNVALERIVPYLRERKLLTFDEVNPLPSRVLARALLENPHPDTTIHCLGNPHYPVNPYMGFWLSPKFDGALYRFASLHPWLVDLRDLSEIVDFGAIDHNFVRAHGYIWSDIHIENDSDNILVLGIKPENDRNAIPNPKITTSPFEHLGRALDAYSSCSYILLFFLHGLRVHTSDLGKDWEDFEKHNLRWLNQLIYHCRGSSAVMGFRQLRGLKFLFWVFRKKCQKVYELVVVEYQLLEALKYFLDSLFKLFFRSWRYGFPRRHDSLPTVSRKCAVCRPDARRCVSGDWRLHG